MTQDESTSTDDLRYHFENSDPRLPEWREAAARYASTPEGRHHLSVLEGRARAEGDTALVTDLRAALLEGATHAELALEQMLRAGPRHARPGARHEIEAVAARFEVGHRQAQRDHAISHVLAALASMDGAEDLTFAGGTALSRTYLPGLRLSEDVDLITSGRRADTAAAIEDSIGPALRRTHGRIRWSPSIRETSGSEPAVLRAPDGTQIQIQLLAAEGREPWPTHRVELLQRYSDAPGAAMRTYTPEAFAAVKMARVVPKARPNRFRPGGVPLRSRADRGGVDLRLGAPGRREDRSGRGSPPGRAAVEVGRRLNPLESRRQPSVRPTGRLDRRRRARSCLVRPTARPGGPGPCGSARAPRRAAKRRRDPSRRARPAPRG